MKVELKLVFDAIKYENKVEVVFNQYPVIDQIIEYIHKDELNEALSKLKYVINNYNTRVYEEAMELGEELEKYIEDNIDPDDQRLEKIMFLNYYPLMKLLKDTVFARGSEKTELVYKFKEFARDSEEWYYRKQYQETKCLVRKLGLDEDNYDVADVVQDVVLYITIQPNIIDQNNTQFIPWYSFSKSISQYYN